MLAGSHLLWTEANRVAEKSVYKEIGARIREARDAAGMTMEELGTRIGYTKYAVSKWEAGTRPISIEALKAIAEVLRRPISYFVRTDMEGLHLDPKFSDVLTSLNVTVLPVYGFVNAGEPAFVMDHVNEYVTVPQEAVGQARFAIRVRGDSMVGLGIHDGDLLFVRPQDDADDGDIVVARVNGEEYTVKRLRKRQGEPPVLESANPDYPPIVGEDVRIVGKVVGQFRMM